jgi:perosamine synthetase
MSTPLQSPPRLAIDGGQPVRQQLLPYGRQQINEEDISAVAAVLRSDWLTTGPKVAEFEVALAAAVGARHAVAVSSGTAALHAAAFAAGIGPGDEVITTPLTFCATSNCVIYQGGTPVFADVCADTLNIDPAHVEARFTKQTKAVIAVDYAGHPAELDQLSKLAHDRGALLIEDACHALGAEYGGRKVGPQADMTVFSFHPVKHITTGEGGMVTTNDEKLAHRLRIFRSHGIDSDPRLRQERGLWQYDMSELGYNYRLPDVACVLGISQLKRLDKNLSRRRAIAARYTDVFKALPGIIPPAVRPQVTPAWHLYPIRVDAAKLRGGRAAFFRALRAENIGVNVHYIPVHMHSYYRNRFGYKGGEYPVAESAYEQLISLPMFHGMSDRDVDDVIAAVTRIVANYAI